MAQPQLVVRFMTVRSKRELNRAVGIGGVFILAMTGVAFTTGALSNAYFSMHGKPFTGRVIKTMDAAKGHVILQLMKVDEKGAWADLVDEKDAKGKSLKTFTQAPVQGADGAWAPVAKGSLANGNVTEGKVIPAVLAADVPAPESPAGGPPLASGRSISIVYAKANPDQIIPSYITTALPKWFGIIFLLTLLAAAMSTLSSQFHTLGTAAGRDVFERIFGAPATAGANRTVHIVRIAIILGLIVAVIFGHYARGGYIIARATAIFFGLCASAFLPAFIGGMFWKRMTKAGAIASMFVGFIVTAFWLVFVKAAEAEAIGLVQKLTGGKTSILADVANWPVVDPLLIALPLSMLTAIVVSFITRPPDAAHIERCFPTSKQTNA